MLSAKGQLAHSFYGSRGCIEVYSLRQEPEQSSAVLKSIGMHLLLKSFCGQQQHMCLHDVQTACNA